MNLRSIGAETARLLFAIAIAAGAGALLLAWTGTSPIEATKLIWEKSVGSWDDLGQTAMVWVPLALAAVGLCVTFQAGLWNIGVEGQIIAGAIGATWAARVVGGPTWFTIAATILAGFAGGAAWASIAGVLRTKAGVNEIFGGLGLDFAAASLAVYLILGPWKRAGVASTSGTEVFDEAIWFPRVGDSRFSWLAVALVVVAALAAAFMLARTRFGLRLRAVGRGPLAAERFGVSSTRYLLAAFALGGGIAGLAGVSQAMAFHHKLVPSISGGYGFLAILVVLVARQRVIVAVGVAFVFAALSFGATALELRLDVDSSIAGVLQALLVFVVLGVRAAAALGTGGSKRGATS